MLAATLRATAEVFCQEHSVADRRREALANAQGLSALTDAAANLIDFDSDQRQLLLECLDPARRASTLLAWFNKDVETDVQLLKSNPGALVVVIGSIHFAAYVIVVGAMSLIGKSELKFGLVVTGSLLGGLTLVVRRWRTRQSAMPLGWSRVELALAAGTWVMVAGRALVAVF